MEEYRICPQRGQEEKTLVTLCLFIKYSFATESHRQGPDKGPISRRAL